ncbi:glucose transporter [Aureococcus anophagefferens]|uniref:Glucose transporter n=1 Tax=Aureococcus anophagefferens TaxID=44056 RepID=A0ABR1GDF9_AURAN
MSDGDKLVEMSVSVNGETTNPMASSAYDSLRQDSPRPGNRAPSTGEAGAADDAWQSVSRTFFFSVIAVMNQVTFGYDVGAVSQCLVPIQKAFHLTLEGLGVGASWASSGIYVTEIAPSHKRGALVSLVDVSINLGIVVGYILAVVPPFLFVVCAPFLPESPRWLLARRRDDERASPRRKLRRRGAPEATVSDAFDALRRERDAHAAGDDVVEGTWAGAAASKEGKYAALLGVAQQATGTEAILYFAPTVLPKHNPFDAFLGNVGIGLAKFGGEVVASYLSDSPRLGRAR